MTLTSQQPIPNGIANVIQLPDGRTATVTGGGANNYRYKSSDGFTCTTTRFADPNLLAMKLSANPQPSFYAMPMSTRRAPSRKR